MSTFEDITDRSTFSSKSPSATSSSSTSALLLAPFKAVRSFIPSIIIPSSPSTARPALFISLYLLSQYFLIEKEYHIPKATSFEAKTVPLTSNNNTPPTDNNNSETITYSKSISRLSDRRIIKFTLTSNTIDLSSKTNDELFSVLVHQFEVNEHEKAHYKATRHWLPKSVTFEREIISSTEDGIISTIKSNALNYSRIVFGTLALIHSSIWFKQFITK
ncbi:hypothetical protein FDP41_006214 [Naegleria fowleri]|uniref:Uncharacterized protein n=1 Tax=Naegleria fowleri TaxID=5763 RepID=A0A6A5BL63_NAEFO|nr:uncharacterized protein FDP41_006214 [Naegleria fowleri]KAF0974740.1 hypothetical protein FDP41_006214 [Naegleria fowleri]CAG4716777.1 unnamed protein product [Naegleria fowleri]